MVTTTPTLKGHEIVRYHGVVTGHVILGANVLRDWFAGWRDFFGGRARSYEAVLRDAEGAALREMSAKAQADGANAVVGVDLDYETIQVKGSMLMVIATGTAVTMVPKSR